MSSKMVLTNKEVPYRYLWRHIVLNVSQFFIPSEGLAWQGSHFSNTSKQEGNDFYRPVAIFHLLGIYIAKTLSYIHVPGTYISSRPQRHFMQQTEAYKFLSSFWVHQEPWSSLKVEFFDLSDLCCQTCLAIYFQKAWYFINVPRTYISSKPQSTFLFDKCSKKRVENRLHDLRLRLLPQVKIRNTVNASYPQFNLPIKSKASQPLEPTFIRCCLNHV